MEGTEHSIEHSKDASIHPCESKKTLLRFHPTQFFEEAYFLKSARHISWFTAGTLIERSVRFLIEAI